MRWINETDNDWNEWRAWFAWRPVLLEDGKTRVWLEWVERKITDDWYSFGRDYRIPVPRED